MYRNIENANFQLLHDLAQKVVEEEMAVSNLYESPNNSAHTNVYQQYYVPPSSTDAHMNADMMQSYEQMPTTTLPPFANNFNLVQEAAPSNSFEFMAQLAADLVDVEAPSVNINYDANECVYLKDFKEQQERSLLQSSMSPLLAAVNDITKRDAELQLYLNQTSNLEQTLHDVATADNLATCTLIADKPVPSRAKASLPTRYLRLGEISALTNEPSVYAKKLIDHPIKFGPVEGVVRYVSTLDLDVLHIQVPRFYPLLLVDESHVLDVSNDETSNWMRYIRLAETAAAQNLQVFLENGRIYYRTTRAIMAQEELRVGYGSHYGARFLLPVFLANEENSASAQNKTTATRLRPRKLKKTVHQLNAKNLQTRRRLKKSTPKRNLRRKKHNETKIRSEILQKLKKTIHKCDMCPKRCFSLQQLEQHKTKHASEPRRTHVCHICQQKCATPTALESHIKGHTESFCSCIYCKQKFNNVREFSKHVTMHRREHGQYACMHCQKLYAGYHLVRKHVRLFHNSARKFNCSTCGKIFNSCSELKRHQSTHGAEKIYACEQCKKTFARRDQLLVHQRQLHAHTKATIIRKNNKKIEVAAASEMVEKVMPAEEQLTKNVFAASSSNRRKQTPTKLKTLEQKLDTLDYVPLSELLTPYLMSEQELHEEFEKAELEANKHNKICAQEETEQNSLDHLLAVTPTSDLAQFSCHLCPSVSFKRRGVLVNHLTKVHPNVDLDSINCLNAPILKKQLLYHCCYCKNVYHSAGKRKLHILKHHPGCKLPDNKTTNDELSKHVQTVRNIEEDVHKCQLCPRQYAARSRLVAHYRQMHVHAAVPAKNLAFTETKTQVYEEPMMEADLHIMSTYREASASPENKLLKLSSAALELSRYDILNERANDDFQRLPSLFDETPLIGIDGLMDRYNHRSIEVQFFEKIGKL